MERYRKRLQGDSCVPVYSFRLVAKSGRIRWLEINAVVFTWEGKPATLNFLSDITERKLMESQLLQAQKLEAIGQLAAGIAHEINTPAQYVGDNTRFLQDSFTEILGLLQRHNRLLAEARLAGLCPALTSEIDSAARSADVEYLTGEVPRAIEQSLEGIERISGIVAAMREFAHPDTDERAPTDVNRAIQSTVAVARAEWKHVAEVKMDLDDNLPLVPCLPGRFNQVILNLLINAVHAIGSVVGDGSQGKGELAVSTRRDGDSVEIRVSDTGPGIPEGIQSRIFDPFFTTKDHGVGTGQGLAISHDVVVKKHGGTIAFETEEGKGATFIVRLPIDPREVEVGRAA
jgi:signal transduction histidine kinase